VDVRRHDDVCVDMDVVSGTLLFEDRLEGYAGLLGGEQGASVVTGECDEVVLASRLVAF
jgi:hypothetical protein